MARRSAGVSGLAVTAAGFGIFLAYAGINDVPVLEGLRLVLKGEDPKAAQRSTGAPFTGLAEGGGPQLAGGSTSSLAFTGPLPRSAMAEVHAPGGTIVVHRLLAPQVQRLVDDAARAGIRFGGGGWRSTAQQRLTRYRNGYRNDSEESGSRGRTPTARPGESRHEAGLAVDFTVAGRKIDSHTDRGWIWLHAHAAGYGLRNLASEPWHWSTDGH